MNVSKVEEYLFKGRKDKYWYRDTEKLFLELFPDKLYLVTQLFAATSIKTSLPANIKLFRRAMHEVESGKPFSNYLPAMLYQLNLIRAGRPIHARKIRNFAAAMSGDVNAVVVDRWLMRSFDLDGDKSPTTLEYDVIEYYYQDLATRKGLEPRQVSAMIWSGIRGKGDTRYHSILRHQLFNMFETV
jgi:hypothetical protein